MAATLAALVTYDLPGGGGRIDVRSPELLLAHAHTHRVVAQLAGALRSGLVCGVDREWEERLESMHRAAVAQTLGAHAAARLLISDLDAVGIDRVRVLKGCATGHLDHPRPADRFSTDVDVLLHPNDLHRALACFAPARPPVARRRHWRLNGYEPSVAIVRHGVEHDLHVRLGQGFAGMRVPVDELLERSDRFSIGGTTMHALDSTDRLIHAALHAWAAGHNLRLNSVIDVPRLVLEGAADCDEAIRRTERWGVDAMFAGGIRAAWSAAALPSHQLVEWALRHRAVGRQRIVLASARRLRMHHSITPLLALPPRRWPGYLVPLMYPSSAYLDDVHKSRGGRFRENVRGLVRR